MADITVRILYVLMFMMPLSGFILSVMVGHKLDYFGLFTIPALTNYQTEASKRAPIFHIYGPYSMIGLITAHILDALSHHIICKDNILKRMLPKVFEK